MASLQATRLRKGNLIKIGNDLLRVMDVQHMTPGNKRGFVQTRLRNIRTRSLSDLKLRAEEDVERAVLDEHEMQYLYSDGESLTFMDNESYEQMGVDPTVLGDATKYIKEGDTVILPMYQGQVVGVELPASVELTVAQTDPGVQGDRVSGAKKPATLETGAVVQVPLFVETGDRIKVDTRSGEYLTRV